MNAARPAPAPRIAFRSANQRPECWFPTQVSPDGKFLLLFNDIGQKTGLDIFVLPLQGERKLIPIVQGPVNDVEPQFSPDGRWLAYASYDTGQLEVYVQPFPTTGAKWQLSSGGGRQPMWRRDGKELFFVTDDRKFYAVDVRATSTFEFGTPHLLFDIPSETVATRNSYWPSRDGQRFLVNKLLDTSASPITVVFNWAAGLAKK